MASSMEIWINGTARRVSPGATVATLLSELDLASDRVAVELDRDIVRRPEWISTELAAGARLEIVHFVGGG